MKENLTDEQMSHPLNEGLLKEAEEIKSDRKTLKERLAKLDENRQGVSESVYQKVRADYVAKLNKTMERLTSLKKELEKEQKILVQKKTLVEVEVKSHQEAIEESKLRHALGEFSADEHRELIEQETREVKRLEAALTTLNEGFEKHRKIFEGEEFLKESVTRPEKIPPPPAAEKPPPFETTSRIKVAQEATDRVAEVSPASSQKIPELQILENGKVSQTIPLDKTVHIGRSPANDIVLKEPKVSRKHAEVQCIGGRYILLDLESSNGTFIGGKKITEQILQPNDEILIGNTKMIFKI